MPTEFTYGGQTILSHPVFVETILPFLLVFTIVFAVLQKAKIFGEDKKQIDAIIALVTGLILISFAQAVGIILQLIPFLAVTLVIILVLMLFLGSFAEDSLIKKKAIYIPLALVVIIALITYVLSITGGWQYLYDIFFIASDSNFFVNAIFVIIIAGAIIAVIVGSTKAKAE